MNNLVSATQSARGLAQSKSFAGPSASEPRASVLECGSPLPLLTADVSQQARYSRGIPEPHTPWPHAPTHQLSQRGTYFVTASTYLKAQHFRGAERLCVLHRGLLTVARDFGWHFEAWAVFSNHYHFVAHSPEKADDAESLSSMLSTLHVKTARWANKLDSAPARQVWFNFRETRLTYQKSYFARLNYTHQNPVKHGMVAVANQYPWCSARWFERTASAAMVKSIYRFRTNRVQVFDEFEPVPEW